MAVRWRLLAWSAGAAAMGLVLALAWSLPGNIAQTLYALVFAAIIAAAYHGIGGIVGRFLESPVLVALGMISYGVYVYHVFAPRAVGMGLRALGAPLTLRSGLPLFVLSAALTLLVASLSWRLLERPILALVHRSHRPGARISPFAELKPGPQ